MLTGAVLIQLITVRRSVTVFKRRFDLELTDECIWIEIPIPDGISLFICSHCFSFNGHTKTSEH